MLRLDQPPSAGDGALDTPQDNRRKHPRVRIAARCWIVGGRHTLYVRIHDISRGGLSVRAPVPFRPNEKLDLRLELPGGRQISAEAVVVWTRTELPTPSGPRMGARFVLFRDEGDSVLQTIA
jgi:hypothetical protein